MSIELTKVFVPAPFAMPGDAEWASRLATRMADIGHAAWRALEDIGESRARRELHILAERYAHHPEFAQTLRDAMPRAAFRRVNPH